MANRVAACVSGVAGFAAGEKKSRRDQRGQESGENAVAVKPETLKAIVERLVPPLAVLEQVSRVRYREWLRRVAIMHASRDRQRGCEGARSSHYARLIHASVVAHDGRCAHTGLPMEWSRIGEWDGEVARGGGEYCARFDQLPSVDHVALRPEVKLEVCVWWLNRAKGSGTLASTLEHFSRALEAHDARREWNADRQRQSLQHADHWLPGSRLRELPPMKPVESEPRASASGTRCVSAMPCARASAESRQSRLLTRAARTRRRRTPNVALQAWLDAPARWEHLPVDATRPQSTQRHTFRTRDSGA